MPIDLEQLFHQAEALPDNSKFFVTQANDMAQGSGLRGLRRLSLSAHHAENRAAANAFLQAIQNHPAYGAFLNEVRAPLDTLIQSGKRLTARTIRETGRVLDAQAAMAQGRAFCRNGSLPAGCAAAFAMHVCARGLPINTPEARTAALGSYLKAEFTRHPENALALSKLPADAGIGPQGEKLLSRLHGPAAGEGGFLEREIDRRLEAGADNFRFADFARSWQDACADDIAFLRQLRPETVAVLAADSRAADLTALLREAAPLDPPGGLDVLCSVLAQTQDLSGPAERRNAYAAFISDFVGTDAASGAVTGAELPESFAAAVGHHPDVQEAARTALSALGRLPTTEEARAAVAQASQQFVGRHEAMLRECLVMANNPPVDMNPPLTEATMPRYINVMLEAEDVVSALWNDAEPINAAFLNKVARMAAAMNSASHAVRGDFGADDILGVLRGSVDLLIARSGIPADHLPELVVRSMTKFGPLASDICTVNSAVQDGSFGFAALSSFLRDGMTVYRALEGTALHLISRLSDEERSALDLGSFNAGALSADDRLKRSSFIENTFQNLRSLTEISDAVRTYARAKGLAVPDAAPGAQAAAADEAAAALRRQNEMLARTVSEAIWRDGGLTHEVPSADFQALIGRLAKDMGLDGIEPALIDPRILTADACRAVLKAAEEDSAAGRASDSHQLAALGREKLAESLADLHRTLEGINALPEGDEPDTLRPEHKAILRAVACRSSIRDPAVYELAVICPMHATLTTALKQMATPLGTPHQLLSQLRLLSDGVARFGRALPAGFTETDAAARLFCEVSVATSGLRAERLRMICDNFRSAGGQEAVGALRWLISRHTGDPAKAASALANEAAAKEILQIVSAAVGEPMRQNEEVFTRRITALTEMSGGPDGSVGDLNLFIRNEIPFDQTVLLNRVPPLTPEEFHTLEDMISRLPDCAGHPLSGLIPAFFTANATEILAAPRDPKTHLPSWKDLWRIWTGGAIGRLPKAQGESQLSAILTAIRSAYHQRVLAAVPDLAPALIDVSMGNASSGFITPVKLMELTQPGAELTLEDMKTDVVSLSSLRECTEDNLYGLVTDFARQSPDARWLFRSADGREFRTQPHFIPAENNNRQNPELLNIVDFWRTMSASPAQLARIGQSFSQASLVAPRSLSRLFPGVAFSEHGNFRMEAVQNPDHTVTVDIFTPDNAPVALHSQYVIDPDGRARTTVFVMRNQGR
ncbi:MAG: hypothetical protein J6K46_04400 [Sutterella sp.]|nr:hypothetical protein [Sutterella sp.]